MVTAAAATYGPCSYPRGRRQGNPIHYNNYYTAGIFDWSDIVHTAEQTGEMVLSRLSLQRNDMAVYLVF